MADTNSPSPSESSPGNADENPPRLKLKQILNPISPHLRPPKPAGNKQEGMKSTRKLPMPIPQAEPLDPSEDPAGPPPSPPLRVPLDFDSFRQGQEPQEAPADASGESPEEETESLQAAPDEPPASGWRKASLLLAVLAAAVALFAANHFLDPFGLRPVRAAASVVAGIEEASRPSPNLNRKPQLTRDELDQKLGQMTVLRYLERLKGQRLNPARKPDGLFVGAAFVPVGSPLNPELGLTLKSVEDTVAIIQDGYLQEYQVSLR